MGQIHIASNKYSRLFGSLVTKLLAVVTTYKIVLLSQIYYCEARTQRPLNYSLYTYAHLLYITETPHLAADAESLI